MDYRQQVFPITSSLWLGPFASPERRSALIKGGVTHVLNVGEAPSVLTTVDGPFQEVLWIPLADLERIPDHLAVKCMMAVHRMVCQPEARVYVHCIAGWNRSPTVVWLYLVACGLSEEQARRMIERQACDSVPSHGRLVDSSLIELVRALGAKSFLPHSRPLVLEPIDAG